MVEEVRDDLCQWQLIDDGGPVVAGDVGDVRDVTAITAITADQHEQTSWASGT